EGDPPIRDADHDRPPLDVHRRRRALRHHGNAGDHRRRVRPRDGRAAGDLLQDLGSGRGRRQGADANAEQGEVELPLTPQSVMSSSTAASAPGKRSMSTLRTFDLTKSYGGRTVVRGVNLEVASGEVVGLLGPNGAGKTTTFYMTVGLTAPESGRVVLGGQGVSDGP